MSAMNIKRGRQVRGENEKGIKILRKTHKKVLDVNFENKTIPASLIYTKTAETDWDKKELKTRSAYFLLNPPPVFSVNEQSGARFKLLANERDFFAAKAAGITEFAVRVYRFTEKNSEIFSLLERLKNERLSPIEEGRLLQKLVKEHGLTQDDVARFLGKSRPAVANTLRLLTLQPEVLAFVEQGRLSAGHARTLIRVPQEKQLALAEEAIRRGYSVREMERAIKAYLTPPEILRLEKEQKTAARGEELKTFVEKMRAVFRTQVTLIGNEKKGRIYIDYYTPEDLCRIERLLEQIEEE